MVRLTREQMQARTRNKLLECGPRVVAAEGYEGASIDKIAEAAGFSKGAFYSNFDSKEEFFLETLELHAGQDVKEIEHLLHGVSEPGEIIDRVCKWSEQKATDPVWGLLALELFRHARRHSTFGERHATLFFDQWKGIGNLLLPLAPNWNSADPQLLGAMVLELTYGAASSYSAGEGPRVADLVRLALTSLHRAFGPDSAPSDV